MNPGVPSHSHPPVAPPSTELPTSQPLPSPSHAHPAGTDNKMAWNDPPIVKQKKVWLFTILLYVCLCSLVLSTVTGIFSTTCALLQTTPTHVTPGHAPITAPITAPIQQPMGAYNYQPVPPTSEAYRAHHQQRPTPPASPHQKVTAGILICEYL